MSLYYGEGLCHRYIDANGIICLSITVYYCESSMTGFIYYSYNPCNTKLKFPHENAMPSLHTKLCLTLCVHLDLQLVLINKYVFVTKL